MLAGAANISPRPGLETLALCKNAHWLFDTGLWTLDDDYRVRVAATKFSESGAEGLRLKTLEGQKIRRPSIPAQSPEPRASRLLHFGPTRFTWHGIGITGFWGKGSFHLP